MDYWESNPPGERRERSIAGVRRHLLPLRDRMRFIRDGEEFLPGVQAWHTPGHTPGHMAFLFAGGWCLTGDVAFHDPISYAFPTARRVPSMSIRNWAWRRGGACWTRLADEQLQVIGYHHPMARPRPCRTCARHVPVCRRAVVQRIRRKDGGYAALFRPTPRAGFVSGPSAAAMAQRDPPAPRDRPGGAT